MGPIRFKVDEVKQTPQGWVIVAHALKPGYFQSGPTARLAGCRVQELASEPGNVPADKPHEIRRVFLLKDQPDHERFAVGQKMLLDP